jgi:DHA1 family bicyclomycin/chloramphenicol resistance-like MFS transporter
VATIGPFGVISLIGAMVVFAVGLGILYPTTAAAALARHPHTAGAAAAVIGCAQVSFGVLATTILSLSNPVTAIPMTVLVAGFSVLALISSAVRRSADAA